MGAGGKGVAPAAIGRVAEVSDALRTYRRVRPDGGFYLTRFARQDDEAITRHLGRLAVNGIDPRQTSYVAFAGGGPAQAALLGNQVSAGVSGYGEFEEQIKAGKLRALAVSSEAAMNNVPSLKEQGINIVLWNWRGVFGAPGITTAQRDALVALMDRMVNGPAWKKTLETRGWEGIYLTGDKFGEYVKQNVADTTTILKDLGLAS